VRWYHVASRRKYSCVSDYYYYATAGGAKFWVSHLPSFRTCSQARHYSGNDISRLCKSPSSSSTWLLFTSAVRRFLLAILATDSLQPTNAMSSGTSLTSSPISAIVLAQRPLLCSAVVFSPAISSCSSTSTSRPTRRSLPPSSSMATPMDTRTEAGMCQRSTPKNYANK